MKTFDILAYILLLVGALNWGLVGIFNINLVNAIFGEMTMITRVIYSLVGLAAVYDLLFIRVISNRWNIHLFRSHQTA